MTPSELWAFLPIGYLITVLIETPILILALSKRHPFKRKILSGIWLTACTYPIVVLVLPLIFADHARTTYLVVAEIFAPVMECFLLWLAFDRNTSAVRSDVWRDFGAIVLANLASFGVGEVLNAYNWFGLLT